MELRDLMERQKLPLDVKIYYSKKKIEEFFEDYKGNVYLSMSGADSAVLDFVCKQTKYNSQIERVSVAGAEPPENIKFLLERRVNTLPMGIDKKSVIIKYGYPVVSKAQAMAISRYHNTKSPEQKEKRLNGYIGANGQLIRNGKIADKYRELVYAPFMGSDACCDKFKKKPLKKYEAQSGKYPITGELAEESINRTRQYLKYGCIMHDAKRPKCTPLGFWTKQDILECIKINNIEIPSIYGEVITHGNELKFSGEPRTGCDVCGFGLHLDPERLTRLKARNKKMYDYMLGGGQWVEGSITRPMRRYYGGPIEESNLYWVPSKESFGYRPVLEYVFSMLGVDFEF